MKLWRMTAMKLWGIYPVICKSTPLIGHSQIDQIASGWKFFRCILASCKAFYSHDCQSFFRKANLYFCFSADVMRRNIYSVVLFVSLGCHCLMLFNTKRPLLHRDLHTHLPCAKKLHSILIYFLIQQEHLIAINMRFPKLPLTAWGWSAGVWGCNYIKVPNICWN